MSERFPFLVNLSAGTRLLEHERPWDQVLYETENFVVVPTVGALVAGWVLIVPKCHSLCFGGIVPSLCSEMLSVKRHVCSVVRRSYGEVAVFEHGPSRVGQNVGCGVDHAHLHVVPSPCDLIAGIPRVSNVELRWKRVRGLQDTEEAFQSGMSYLYVEQPANAHWIADASNVPGQLFRRVIAENLGINDQFDWRFNPMEENVHSTVRTLSRMFSPQLRRSDVALTE